MPPALALLLTLGLIAFLFWRDHRQKPNVTGALWIPLIWLLISCSRSITEWLNLGTPLSELGLEESLADRFTFLALIISGMWVLCRRQVHIQEIVRHNRWLTLYLVYCFLAILWSDFPFVAFKRWIKILGHPIMVLIVFTEPDFKDAVTTLLKRCAYVVLPISVLFIKYFPEYGRGFSEWTGGAFNTGITTNKNTLGCDCLILGLFFVWHFLNTRRIEDRKLRRTELILIAGFLAMIGWLLSMAHSLTSLLALVLGLLTLTGVGLQWINKRYIGTYLVAGITLVIVLQLCFGIYEATIAGLGKDATLTDRTEIWEDVLRLHVNPIFGAGFESFWLGERSQIMSAKWSWHPNQAHNGYLETYLNLGLIGLLLLVGLLGAAWHKIRRGLKDDFQFGRLRLAFFLAILAYNWTEASFKAVHALFFIFYLITLEYPRLAFSLVQEAPERVNETISEDYAREAPLT